MMTNTVGEITPLYIQQGIPLNALIEPFMSFEKSRGIAPYTIMRIKTNTGLFLRYLEEKNITTADQLNHDVFQDYAAYLYDRPNMHPGKDKLLKSTIAKHIDFMKHFSLFLQQKRLAYADYAEHLVRPVPKWMVIQALSPEQIRLIFTELGKMTSSQRVRIQKATFLYLLLDTGVRVSEGLRIIPRVIDFVSRLITVTGKGDKERQVPFSPRTAALLQKIIEMNGTARDEYIWKSPRTGNPFTPASIQDTLRRIKRRLGTQAGIDAIRVSPHTIRHTFAKNWITSGGDAFSLQRILGHSSVSMTQKYVYLWSVDLKQRHDLCRPAEGLGIDDSLLFL